MVAPGILNVDVVLKVDLLIFVHADGELVKAVCADSAHGEDVVNWSEALGGEIALWRLCELVVAPFAYRRWEDKCVDPSRLGVLRSWAYACCADAPCIV